jgi:hypothetical protein
VIDAIDADFIDALVRMLLNKLFRRRMEWPRNLQRSIEGNRRVNGKRGRMARGNANPREHTVFIFWGLSNTGLTSALDA